MYLDGQLSCATGAQPPGYADLLSSEHLRCQALVLDYARGHGSINRGECEALLGVKATRATYLLQSLRDRGMLRREGERRWARYVLADS